MSQKARTIKRRINRRRKRRTPHTKSDKRGKRIRTKDTNNTGGGAATSDRSTATTTNNRDNNSNSTPNINRIMPLKTVSSFISNNTVCKDCGGEIIYKSDSKISQVTTFNCTNCQKRMRLEPSKLVEPPPGSGRKRQLREHVLRQSAAIAANGGNLNVFKRQNSMQGLETIGTKQYHDVLVNTFKNTDPKFFL